MPPRALREITQDTYTCPVAAQDRRHRLELPGQRLCLGSKLLQHQLHQRRRLRPFDVADGGGTRGRRVSRHHNMQVFKGEGKRCRDRLFKNCCYSDSAGAGMTNQSLFGTGSRLVVMTC